MLTIVFVLIILLFSIVIHEVAHGSMAYHLGDPTAKYAGRLTLNPIPHIDPIGSIILPGMLILMSVALGGGGIIFGWAKPVPINPYNFRDQKYGEVKVALAGPGANLLLALVFGLVLRFLPDISAIPGLYLMFSYIVFINVLLAFFNLLPVPPFDGSHVLFAFLPASYADGIKMFFAKYSLFLLLILFWGILYLFPLIIRIVDWVCQMIIGAPFLF